MTKFKHWFKRTKIGRALRHVQNFFWRLHLDERAWQREDPQGYRAFQAKRLSISE